MEILAHCFCLFFSSSYVLSLYCIPERIRTLPRNNIVHVQYRMLACSISTAVSIGIYFMFLCKETWGICLRSLGVVNIAVMMHATCLTSLLMILFYLGPATVFLYHTVVCMNNDVTWKGTLVPKPNKSRYQLLKSIAMGNLAALHGTLHFRNLVFAPFSEEIVFRGLIVAALLIEPSKHNENGQLAGTILGPVGRMCLLVPAWFAVAHAHHLMEKIFAQKQALLPALASTIVQLVYTSIFGIIATYLHLRTGTIAAPITSHIICNFVGLPDMSFCNPPGQFGSTVYSHMHPYRVVLVVLHVVGLLLFYYAVSYTTQSMAEQSELLSQLVGP